VEYQSDKKCFIKDIQGAETAFFGVGFVLSGLFYSICKFG